MAWQRELFCHVNNRSLCKGCLATQGPEYGQDSVNLIPGNAIA